MFGSRFSRNSGYKIRGAWILIATLLFLISGTLIYKSLPVPFQQYQQYRNQVARLSELEANFSQEVLRARYELFAYYDPIVNNLVEQEDVLNSLTNIPSFVNVGDQREIRNFLESRQASLEQKENLSEVFKARNALLKNSLRYLPFLSDQIDTKLSTLEPTETIDSEKLAALNNTLNQLIRNLLLFTTTTDEALSNQLQSLLRNLNQLQNTLEISETELPLQLVQSHSNIIFNAKPLIEEATTELLKPLDTSTAPIASTFESSYRLALASTRVIRFFTYGWFLLLLVGGLLWVRYQNRETQITLRQSNNQLETMATALSHILNPKTDVETSEAVSKLMDYTTQENSLGRLAKCILQLKTERQEPAPVAHQD
ncbi:pas domain s-box [Leptolyngbya sp. Heron Island J]|uniref:DAHL domain-containing protein n=1 Tax=Leptolyngbya sp. Heron Island J TaxID=1385935 RepID=UPI0003B99248|nr:DAHL domain-containing protein [Leptolyngbya sp. Heron Island J]ESA32806.1 pas domain s-box [Leptolyngbya sp. Heron Island J]